MSVLDVIKGSIVNVKQDIKGSIVNVKQDIKGSIVNVKQDIKVSIVNVKQDIKGSIVNVRQDISSGLNKLASVSERRLLGDDGLVDINTGADLLLRYQNYWRQIHRNSLDLSRRARAVDWLVTEVYETVQRQNAEMNELLAELSTASQLTAAVTSVKKQLGGVERGCAQLETLLMQLEDVCEEQEERVRREQAQAQLLLHQQNRSRELLLIKVDLEYRSLPRPQTGDHSPAVAPRQNSSAAHGHMLRDGASGQPGEGSRRLASVEVQSADPPSVAAAAATEAALCVHAAPHVFQSLEGCTTICAAVVTYPTAGQLSDVSQSLEGSATISAAVVTCPAAGEPLIAAIQELGDREVTQAPVQESNTEETSNDDLTGDEAASSTAAHSSATAPSSSLIDDGALRAEAIVESAESSEHSGGQ